jgi:hypothetical protein
MVIIVTIYEMINGWNVYYVSFDKCLQYLMYVSCMSRVCVMYVSGGKGRERKANGGTWKDCEGLV